MPRGNQEIADLDGAHGTAERFQGGQYVGCRRCPGAIERFQFAEIAYLGGACGAAKEEISDLAGRGPGAAKILWI